MLIYSSLFSSISTLDHTGSAKLVDLGLYYFKFPTLIIEHSWVLLEKWLQLIQCVIVDSGEVKFWFMTPVKTIKHLRFKHFALYTDYVVASK